MRAVALASRYRCAQRATGYAWAHSQGEGAPEVRRCRSCGGGLMVESGYWGVFGPGEAATERRYRRPGAAAAKAAFLGAAARREYAAVWVRTAVRYLPPR